jgi:ABC-type transport system substrate-binding protein
MALRSQAWRKAGRARRTGHGRSASAAASSSTTARRSPPRTSSGRSAQQLDENNKFAEGKQIVENFEELRADGPDTVIIRQRQVNFDLPAHLSSFGLLIGKQGTTDWDAGNGTGPYTLEAYEPGVRFAGRKFANFYRDDQGHFDEVEVLNIADPNARASGLLSGSLDVIGSPNVVAAQRLAVASGFELIEVRARSISRPTCAPMSIRSRTRTCATP